MHFLFVFTTCHVLWKKDQCEGAIKYINYIHQTFILKPFLQTGIVYLKKPFRIDANQFLVKIYPLSPSLRNKIKPIAGDVMKNSRYLMVLNSTVIYPQHCIRAAYVQTSHFVSHLAGLYIGCGYSGCGIGWGVCSELVNILI